MNIFVHYIYHSCFAVGNDEVLVVFDYWQDPQGRLASLLKVNSKKLYFVVSHFHADHFSPEILSFPNACLLLSYDTVKRRHVDPARYTAMLRPGQTYVDDHLRLDCYRSTDIGISSALTFPDGTVCFHAGDLNNWHMPEEEGKRLKVTPLQMEKLYLSILRDIAKAHSHIDHLMFPVDPRLGDETLRGLRQWAAKIPTGMVHPMHCWGKEQEMRALAATIDGIRVER